ncbi:MAG: hypothetical protein ACFCUV_26300, partial [Rivularia sp. (in: cyanobacteria)]
TLTNTLEYKLQDNTTYKIVSSHYKQQRLKDISLRLEEIHKEQQELLQEATHILDSERINNSVN